MNTYGAMSLTAAMLCAVSVSGCSSQENIPATATRPWVSQSELDQLYFDTMNRKGVEFDNVQDAVDVGRGVCWEISSGTHPVYVVQHMVDTNTYTRDQAVTVVGSAIAAYCPEHKPDLIPHVTPEDPYNRSSEPSFAARLVYQHSQTTVRISDVRTSANGATAVP